MVPVKFSALENALRSLENSLDPPPANDRERDGAIQRFEYTLELCWKTGQKILKAIGVESHSPKSVFRDLAQQDLIQDPQAWIDFVDCRNESSHLYREEVAEKVFLCVPLFFKEAKKLLVEFKKQQKKTRDEQR